MSEATKTLFDEMLKLRPAIEAAHERANREARLEHARMGRPVCESHDGKVVWLTPEEVFAQYGFDEHGKPKV